MIYGYCMQNPQTMQVRSLKVELTYIPGIALGIVTAMLWAIRPDIEKYLSEHAPGNPMPDAFKGLNETIPFVLLFAAITCALAGQIARNGKHALFLPLLFGPSICIIGWLATENFRDPNWFHLTALSTIGMLVSSAVTFVLMRLKSK